MKTMKALLVALVVALGLSSVAYAVQVDTTTTFDRSFSNQSVLKTSTGADTNSTSTVTESVFAGGASAVSYTVSSTSGAHDTHVVTLQGSTDNSTWTSTSTTTTGAGGATVTPVYPYYRLKVTTAQGAASVSVLTIFAKNL